MSEIVMPDKQALWQQTDHRLYYDLVAYIQSLSAPIKHTLICIYDSFSTGAYLNFIPYQPIMDALAKHDIHIDAENGLITSCFGCYASSGCSTHYGESMSQKRTEHLIDWETGQAYAWCIWDAFFIVKVIGKPALITSIDPISQQRVEVFFDGQSFAKAPLWFSFPLGNRQESTTIQSCFCCRTKVFVLEQDAKKFADYHHCEVVTMEQMLERTDLMVNAFCAGEYSII